MNALNGAIAVVFALLTLTVLSKGVAIVLLLAAVALVAVLNIYIIGKAAKLLSDEEWWKSRIRVLELQRQAADLERDLNASTQAPQSQLVALPPPDTAKVE